MSVDGTWKLTMTTPRGDQQSTLTIKSDGDAFTGVLTSARGAAEIKDGKVDGAKLSWTSQLTSPMPLTLTYNATVEGDLISGNVALGAFGNAPLKGARA